MVAANADRIAILRGLLAGMAAADVPGNPMLERLRDLRRAELAVLEARQASDARGTQR